MNNFSTIAMIQILKPGNDPYFNIAAEEYLVKNTHNELLVIWENADSVVVGKHQNSFAEVNIGMALQKNIPIIRRISGGGTVVQGSGNINFSLITNQQNDLNKIDFQKFTLPVIKFLASLGVPVTLSGKSNLTIHGQKFSGNAAHVFKHRSLHHGTLLFDANIALINELIDVKSTSRFDSKAIPSNRASITNIRPWLAEDMGIEAFIRALEQFMWQYFNVSAVHELSVEAIADIQQLSIEKYQTWEWNYGYSPDFVVEKTINTKNCKADVQLSVQKGVIRDICCILKEECSVTLPSLTEIQFEEKHLQDYLLQQKLGWEHKEVVDFVHQLIY